MKQTFSKRVGQALANVWPLYGAVFAMAISLSVLWTAMPFIIRNIGGTEEHVGYIWAANMLGYMLCLLFAAVMLGHTNPRHTTRIAAAAMFLATLVMVVVVYYAIAHNQLGRSALIWTIIAAGTLAGAAMSLFWPFLMSWVSADYEGAILNRRLGTYNGMWSAAAIIGPLIGGMLVDVSTLGRSWWVLRVWRFAFCCSVSLMMSQPEPLLLLNPSMHRKSALIRGCYCASSGWPALGCFAPGFAWACHGRSLHCCLPVWDFQKRSSG